MNVLTYEKFLEKYGDFINKNIEIIGEYVDTKTPILCRCKIDGYTWMAKPSKLKLGRGCPLCSGKTVIVGVNDIATTHPEILNILEDKNDGFKYSHGSNKIIRWKCDVCGKTTEKAVSEVIARGLKCKYCSDGFPFDEKFMCNLLYKLNIPFTYQFKPDFAKGRKYDFLLNTQNVIVELDGGLGHGRRNYSSSTLSNQDCIDIDNFKTSVAIENGYKIIRIDTDYPSESSKYIFIINNIVQSDLKNIIDFSSINFDEIIKESSKSILPEVCNLYNQGLCTSQISNITGLNICTVITYLKQGRSLNLCNYKTQSEKLEIPVTCINTQKHYESLTQITKDFNAKYREILKCCNKESLFSGRDKNGFPLMWVYTSEFEGLNNAFINILKTTKTNASNHIFLFDEMKERILFGYNLLSKETGISNKILSKMLIDNGKLTIGNRDIYLISKNNVDILKNKKFIFV